MKCPVHPDKDVVGYCVECGAFGCDSCLVSRGKGDSLCHKCEKALQATAKEGKKGFVAKLRGDKKTPKPQPGRPTFERSSVARKASAGRKLIVNFRDGRKVRGTTYKLDARSLGFHLVPLDPSVGEDRMFVNFSETKCIRFVRSFEGGAGQGGGEEYTGEGHDTKAVFRDGETIEGRTLHRYDAAVPRFFIVPKDTEDGTISILIERSALKGLEVGGFREGVLLEEPEDIDITAVTKKGRAPLSQNESMGDLYFSMKNYDSALVEYEKVREEYPNDKRLNLKISICNFNRGVNFIKSRKYKEAKVEFEKISEDDPIYDKAKKKIRKIDKILKEVQTMGT